MPNSNPSRRHAKANSVRPPKPYPDFPLCPHPAGAWQKKILGKVHYFGRWGRVVNGKMERLPDDGWQAALNQYIEQKDDLYAGRKPRVETDCIRLKELCNRFLTAKKLKCDSGEIKSRTFAEYQNTTDLLIGQFGKDRVVEDLASDDFEQLRSRIAKRCGPIRLGNEVQRVRTVFKYGIEAGLISKPVAYGPEFKKPDRSVLRKHRAGSGRRMFESVDIRAMLDKASPQLRAMILLAINAGFGNNDCGTLPMSAIDFDAGWIDYARPKTGIARRCPLWPETCEAIRFVMSRRRPPKAKDHLDLLFITKYGEPWARDIADSAITKAMRKLLDGLGLHKPGLGFYTLRHVFRTIADGSRDQVAINHIMGHADDSMGATYRERIDDSRLKSVVEHVRAWLWPESTNPKRNPRSKTNAKPKPSHRAHAAKPTIVGHARDSGFQLRIVS